MKRILIFSLILSLIIPSPAFARKSAEQYNEKGVEYYDAGSYDEALEEFEKALSLSPDNETIKKNLSFCYYKMGEKNYKGDYLEDAIENWEKALELNPGITYLAGILEKARQEALIEKSFKTKRAGHFIVKFEGTERYDLAYDALNMLKRAYRDVGWHLDTFPDDKLIVIIYTADEFKEITKTTDWTSGVYDGKIRLRIGDLLKDKDELRNIIYHEYTHALVHSVTDDAPTWLNEGIAQYEGKGKIISPNEERWIRDFLETNPLVELTELAQLFNEKTNQDKVTLAYLESRLFVRYLISRYYYYRMRQVLRNLAQGLTLEESFQKAYYTSLTELEKRWKKRLKNGLI